MRALNPPVHSELLVTERGCVEDQPQQPDCRIKSSLPNPLCDGKLLRLASEAQPRSVAHNSDTPPVPPKASVA